MNLIIGDLTNAWNAIVIASVVMAVWMFLQSELLRWLSHKMTSVHADEKLWGIAAGHLRWSIQLSRSAHVLGFLALIMQQARVESVKQLALANGVIQAIEISDTGGTDGQKTRTRAIETIGHNPAPRYFEEPGHTVELTTEGGYRITWVADGLATDGRSVWSAEGESGGSDSRSRYSYPGSAIRGGGADPMPIGELRRGNQW